MAKFIIAAIPIPPGETLLELLESKKMTQKELASRLNYTQKYISELIQGKIAITPQTSVNLEKVFGVPASFLIGLELAFQDAKIRKAGQKQI